MGRKFVDLSISNRTHEPVFEYNEALNSRVCVECGREFQPSSGHLRCPSCRSHNRCARGARKGLKYATSSARRTESGEPNSNWRGGRTRDKRGYILLWAPEHPRTGNGSYAFEPVLAMAKMLGRYLLR